MTSPLSSSFEGMEGIEDEEDVGMFRLVDVEEGSEVVLVLLHIYPYYSVYISRHTARSAVTYVHEPR